MIIIPYLYSTTSPEALASARRRRLCRQKVSSQASHYTAGIWKRIFISKKKAFQSEGILKAPSFFPDTGRVGGGGLSYMVINRYRFELNSAILVTNRVWFSHSSLDIGMFLRRSHFFIIIKKKINKRLSQVTAI